MKRDQYSMDGSRLSRFLVPIVWVAGLGIGTGCAGPSYEDTHTRVEASGEQNVATVNIVRNPANERRIYTCQKGEDKLQCRPACGSGEIRCPASMVNVKGTSYGSVGLRSTTPNDVSPEARQPSKTAPSSSGSSSSADRSSDDESTSSGTGESMESNGSDEGNQATGDEKGGNR